MTSIRERNSACNNIQRAALERNAVIRHKIARIGFLVIDIKIDDKIVIPAKMGNAIPQFENKVRNLSVPPVFF